MDGASSSSSSGNLSRSNSVYGSDEKFRATMSNSKRKKTDSGWQDDRVMQGENILPNTANNNDWGGRDGGQVLRRAHAQAMRSDREDPDPSVFRLDLGGGGEDQNANYNELREIDDSLQILLQDPANRTPETIRLSEELRTILSTYEEMRDNAKASNKNYCPWEFSSNFLSGAAAFLMCFGVGTAAASALNMPIAGWAISTVLWALTERYIPLIRNTTWKSAHAERTYPLIANLIQDTARNAVRKAAGMEAQSSNIDGREPIELKSITERDFMEAWRGKMVTEDLPYYFYTFWYGVRYSIIAGMRLPAASPASLLSLLAAGTLAGASTAVSVQYLRRFFYASESREKSLKQGVSIDMYKGQTLTKTLGMWQKEIQILKKKKELFAAFQLSADDNDLNQKINIQKYILAIDEQIRQAGARASFFSMLRFEMAALWNPMRTPGETRGEVAGKRSEFIAGLFSKATVLGISTGFNYGFTMKMLEATVDLGVKRGIMWGQYGMLIVAFNSRKEFELAYRGIIGLGLGIYDVISSYCSCCQSCNCCCTSDFSTVETQLEHGERPSHLRSINSTQELGESYRREKSNNGSDRDQIPKEESVPNESDLNPPTDNDIDNIV